MLHSKRPPKNVWGSAAFVPQGFDSLTAEVQVNKFSEFLHLAADGLE